MGRYTTRILSDDEIKSIIKTIASGYKNHKPNEAIATVLLLQANLGCRIGDIVNLRTDSIVPDCGGFRLNIIEQKTGKKRMFVIPSAVKQIIDDYATRHGISYGRKLFRIGEQAVWKALRQVTEYLNIGSVSAHSFRKAAGLRVYLDSGMDIALTTQFYQHASPAITMKYLQRNTKQMDELLSKSVFTL